MPPPSVYHRSSKGSNRPTVPFDSDVPTGVDPEAAWRLANSGKGNRKGTTSAQRAGIDPGYTPGYGRSAQGNRPYGFSSNWADNFTPGKIQIPKSGQEMEGGTVLPPAANPPAANVATPPPPSVPPVPAPSIVNPPAPATTGMETISGTGQSINRITGLPKGQKAYASFVPGQNNPASLSRRTRQPVDPLA